MSGGLDRGRSRFRPASLDALSFLLADVRGALGPYLNVFLVTRRHWSQSEVGLVTAVGGWLGLAVQTPVGAAIDATRMKRGAIVFALAVLAAGALCIYIAPRFWPVLVANTLIAMVGDVFGPAVAALTLGLVRQRALARRLGRNAAFDHAGNVAIAALAGAVGWIFSQRAVFLLVPVFAVLAAAATLSIPSAAIDERRARGAREAHDGEATDDAASPLVLLECRPLVIFGCCAMLFHFANAPLLPLVGQKLAFAHQAAATAMMSLCIIAAQLVMVPIALLVGWRADIWGRMPILLVGFTILPIRAALYTLSNNSAWLIRDSTARRGWRGYLWRPHAAGGGRPHARDRALQPGPRRDRHYAGHRRFDQRPGRRADRGSLRLLGGVPDIGRGGCGRPWRPGVCDARDRTGTSGGQFTTFAQQRASIRP